MEVGCVPELKRRKKTLTTTYHNKDRLLEVECDDCGLTDEYEGDFNDCIDDLKADGWIIKREHGQFTHYCGDCED